MEADSTYHLIRHSRRLSGPQNKKITVLSPVTATEHISKSPNVAGNERKLQLKAHCLEELT